MRSSTSSWLHRLGGQLLRVGPLPLQWAGTLLALTVAVAGAVATVQLAGAGQALAAAAVAGLTCALLAPWALAAALRVWAALGRAHAAQCGEAPLDAHTGVLSRQHFITLAEAELARCRRYQTPAALLLIDADHFRRLNEEHGRACGDALLREIGRLTQDLLRRADLLARFGGEEFVALLPHTDPLGALDVADRVRTRVSELRLPWRGHEVRTTVSVGVAPLSPAHPSVEAAIQEAGAALFAAKEAGRNCVRAAPAKPRRRGHTRRVSERK